MEITHMPKTKSGTKSTRHFNISKVGTQWVVNAESHGGPVSSAAYKTESAAIKATLASRDAWLHAGHPTEVKLHDAAGKLVEHRADRPDGTHTDHVVEATSAAKSKAHKPRTSKKGGKTEGWHAFQAFAKEKRAAGMSEADIGAAWAKHKAAGGGKAKAAPKSKPESAKPESAKSKSKKTSTSAALPHGHVVAPLPPMAGPSDGDTPKGKGGHKKAKAPSAAEAAKSKTPKVKGERKK